MGNTLRMNVQAAVSRFGRSLWHKRPRGRVFVLLVVLSAWALVVLARLTHLMLFPGEGVLAAVRNESWIEGEIPAPRGCILDRNGYPLAWSSRHFLVQWCVPRDAARASEELAILRRILGAGLPVAESQLAGSAARSILLKKDLSPAQLRELAQLRGEFPGLEITGYTVRHRSASAALQQRLGMIAMVDGRETGMSGEEKFNEDMLSGRPGRFRVMVGKDGKWLKETWQKTVDILPGYDVYLPITVGAAVPELASSR